MKKLSLLFAICALAACSSKDATPSSTSTVTGALAVDSFHAAPTALVAIDETGAKASAVLDAQGNFHFTLAKAHAYRFEVTAGASTIPIVFPRAGALETVFRVDTGAATIAFGLVHHYDTAPAAGFTTLASSATCDQSGTDTTDPTASDGETADDGNDPTASDGETADDGADPTKEMAVPDNAVPTDVQGCDSQADGETQD